jgi:hypothetical protein
MVISDIASSSSVPIDIQYNEKLRGECIGGAMREHALFAMLRDLSFEYTYIIKRFLYREVKEFPFYSITYSSRKPSAVGNHSVIYRGPFAGLIMDNGQLISRGITSMVDLPDAIVADESLFQLDRKGNVTNIDQETTCSCFTAPGNAAHPIQEIPSFSKHSVDCMVCGNQLIYLETNREETCYFCQKEVTANAVCKAGHFVCDNCHSIDGKKII